MQKIKLQSSDLVIFEIDLRTAQGLGIVKTMLDILGQEGDDIVPLPKVDSKTLRIVLEWVKQKIRIEISPWNGIFLNVNNDALIKLAVAANYLDMPELLDIVSSRIAKTIVGLDTNEMRKRLSSSSKERSGIYPGILVSSADAINDCCMQNNNNIFSLKNMLQELGKIIAEP